MQRADRPNATPVTTYIVLHLHDALLLRVRAVPFKGIELLDCQASGFNGWSLLAARVDTAREPLGISGQFGVGSLDHGPHQAETRTRIRDPEIRISVPVHASLHSAYTPEFEDSWPPARNRPERITG